MRNLSEILRDLTRQSRRALPFMLWHEPPADRGPGAQPGAGWWLARGARCTIEGDPRGLIVCRGGREEIVAARELGGWLREEMPPGSEIWGVWDYESLLVLSGLPCGEGIEGGARLFVPERIEALRGPAIQCPRADPGDPQVDGPVRLVPSTERVSGALATGAGYARRPGHPLRFHPTTSRDQHASQVASVREAIAAGDVYEVNLTFEVEGPALDLEASFPRMVAANPAPYASCYVSEERQILSLSPELFFSIRDRRVTTRPMKGTRPRLPGIRGAADEAERHALAMSGKDRAENLMIVDLARHDLRRVCEPDSVEVTRLCEIEAHPRVFQMVSEVSGDLATDDLAEILAALGPGGSMTGAPKWTATDLIRRLEVRRRGAYAGAVGRMRASSDMCWSMGIRLVEQDDRVARIGCGGAIVWDSTSEGEWQEALIKARSVVEAAGGHLETGP